MNVHSGTQKRNERSFRDHVTRRLAMFSSKTVLVTGATSGIGRATALHLARLGHRVIATGRKHDELAKLEAEAGTSALETLSLDVTSEASIAAAVVEVDVRTGGRGLDVLVNNA